MIGNRSWLADVPCAMDAPACPKPMEPRRYRSAAFRSARLGPAIVATLLLFVLALQCFELRAELLFRSAEWKDGQRHWSALKKYADPADTAYPRTLADGTQVPAEEVQVFLNGFITSADVHSAKAMISLLIKGRQKIAGNVVSFASNGGEIDAALELGRLLRKLGVSTVVARGDQCMSACVFAFMGGDRRTVAGRIGIHRPYFSWTLEVPDRRGQYRQMQKRLQEYIEELDFPPSFYEAVMAVPSQSVNILSSSDLKRFYLDGMSPSAEDEADAASARGLGISVTEYLPRKTQALPCVGAHGVLGTCVGEAQKAAGSGPAAEDPARQQKGEAAPGNVAVGRAEGKKKAGL